jgi:hypothetical protein
VKSIPGIAAATFQAHAGKEDRHVGIGRETATVGKQPTDGLFTTIAGARPVDCTDGLNHPAAFSELVHGGTLIDLVRPESVPPPPVAGLQYGFASVVPPTQSKLLEMCCTLGPNHG